MTITEPPPTAVTCGCCNRVRDTWVWDEEDQEWEPDFAWWRHLVSDHEFLCSVNCWRRVHSKHCGDTVDCGYTTTCEDPAGVAAPPGVRRGLSGFLRVLWPRRGR